MNFLSDSFGFTIIKNVRLDSRITASRLQPVGADEAVDIINSMLKDKGYGILRTGMILRIDTIDNIKLLNTPVYFGADPEKIPVTDTMITQVIPLNTVDADRLRRDLANMFSPDAIVVANAASNTLVITDRAASIHRIVEVVSSMDKQHAATSDIKVFKLKYANAAAAAKLIGDIFKADTTAGGQSTPGGRGGRGGSMFFGGPGGMPGALASMMAGANQPQGTGARTGTVIASSDDRTNTVVVTGPPEILKIIEEQIITKLDSDPAQDSTFFVYAMKNANAVNLQGVLNGFFGSGSASTAVSNRSNTGFQALTSSNMSTSSNARTTTNTTASRTGGGATGNTGSRNTNGISSAATDLIGQAYVVAEPDTNSLLVTVKTPYKDRVLDLLKALDRDVPQVLIKVLVCEVTHTDSSDIGVEWSILAQRTVVGPNGTTSTVGSAGGTDFGIAKALSTAAASGTPSGLVASVVESNIAAALSALASRGKLDVLSRPSILASDNQLASIMVGQLVPIITSSNVTSYGNIINTPSYTPVGIILNVTPHINPDGLVILDVQPQVSQLSTQTVTIQAGVDIPVIDLRQAQSRVTIRNGQTIIIGGLMRDQITSTVDKVPLLGDIPWLGEIFKHTTDSKSKTELLIFITPQVASSPDMLLPMSKDEQSGVKLVPNAVAPGIFDDHMKGMQRGYVPTPLPPDLVYPKPPSYLPPSTAPAPATQPANIVPNQGP
ncbi:MAG: type II secretion system secretin GspD [Phycisphaerales bacterium]|nr:type II secretion system secretin GspD [Phycisphaerales bacterium]